MQDRFMKEGSVLIDLRSLSVLTHRAGQRYGVRELRWTEVSTEQVHDIESLMHSLVASILDDRGRLV